VYNPVRSTSVGLHLYGWFTIGHVSKYPTLLLFGGRTFVFINITWTGTICLLYCQCEIEIVAIYDLICSLDDSALNTHNQTLRLLARKATTMLRYNNALNRQSHISTTLCLSSLSRIAQHSLCLDLKLQ